MRVQSFVANDIVTLQRMINVWLEAYAISTNNFYAVYDSIEVGEGSLKRVQYSCLIFYIPLEPIG